MSLGERIAYLRQANGMTQADLAKDVHRSESWVSQVERGALTIDRISVLEGLAQALGVSSDDLLKRWPDVRD